MDTVVLMYLAYTALSVGLTIWVAHTLSKHGRVFLVDVFDGKEDIADSVNHLLVVGFYLLNLGYVALALKTADTITTAQQGVEALAYKVGLVLLVLGGMHFANIFVFARIRRRSQVRTAPPPVRPDGRLSRGSWSERLRSGAEEERESNESLGPCST